MMINTLIFYVKKCFHLLKMTSYSNRTMPHAINRPKFYPFLKKRDLLYSQTGQLGPRTLISSRIYESDYLKIQVSKHNIPNLQELWTIVQTEFFKNPEVFSRICLIQSQEELMPLSRTKAIQYDTENSSKLVTLPFYKY